MFQIFPDYFNDPKLRNIVADMDGNIYVFISRYDNAGEGRMLKVTPDGSLPWGENGIFVYGESEDIYIRDSCHPYYDPIQNRILLATEVFYYSEDTQNYVHDLRLQSISTDGELQWGDLGVLMMTTPYSWLMYGDKNRIIPLSDGSFAVLTVASVPFEDRSVLMAGKFYPDGSVAGNSVIQEPSDIQADQWQILSAYPNPFNSAVTIKLKSGNSKAGLKIYDISGREVFRSTIHKQQREGNIIEWKPSPETSSGIYFIKLESKQCQAEVKKIVLLK